MKAVDVYETRELADTLVQNTIAPVAAQLGLPLPEIIEYEVYTTLRTAT